MVPNGPFWMVRLKIVRAKSLITEASRELELYAGNPPIEITTTSDSKRFEGEMRLSHPPLYAAAIIGDVVHNLRSSLDLLACDLVRLNKQSDKNVHFPIATSEADIDDLIKRHHFHRAGVDAVNLLKNEIKPYKGGASALRALHELDLQDKHTMLIPSMQNFETEMTFAVKDGKPDFSKVTHVLRPGSFKFVFPDNTPLGGEDIIPTLHRLAETVESAAEAFISQFHTLRK